MNDTRRVTIEHQTNADALRSNATELDGDRLLVAEHAVKSFLKAGGLLVPNGLTSPTPEGLAGVVGALREPLVLKAFGPGIVHKSELGAVKLDVTRGDLVHQGEAMRARLEKAGRQAAGYLVEEQQSRGIELLVGVVVKNGVGIVMCGLGGIYTEALSDIAVRLLPLTARDADEMLRDFRGSAVLDSKRSGASANRAALAGLLLKLAGQGGVMDELLAAGLLEFECNPVILTANGPCLADARLILAKTIQVQSAPPPARNLTPIFKPKSIAVAGVSTSGRGIGNMSLEAYRRFGWTDGLYVIHPTAKNFGDVPAYPSLADVPGGRVDYLKVTLPAPQAVALLKADAARAGGIQVVSGGFGELGGPEHKKLEAELLDAVRTAKVPMVGPNCIGTYSPAGRQTYQLSSSAKQGSVSLVSQSGGVCSDIVEIGGTRGLAFAKALSVGNANDVSPAEVLEYLVDDPDTAVIGMYLEDMRDSARFVRALRAAGGKKPVVVLMSGTTETGATATASHTGAMTTDTRLLEAMEGSTGLIAVNGTEELIGALMALQHYAGRVPTAPEPSVLIVGHGGGHSVLSADTCERAGLHVPALTPAAANALTGIKLGLEKILINPLELIMGPMTAVDSTRNVLSAILSAQPFTDVLLHLSVRTFYASSGSFFEHGAAGDQLEPLLQRLQSLAEPLPGNPRVFISARASEVMPGLDRQKLMAATADAGLPLYFSGEEAIRAMRTVSRFERTRRLA